MLMVLPVFIVVVIGKILPLHSLFPTYTSTKLTHQAFQETSWAGNDNHQLFYQLYHKGYI